MARQRKASAPKHQPQPAPEQWARAMREQFLRTESGDVGLALAELLRQDSFDCEGLPPSAWKALACVMRQLRCHHHQVGPLYDMLIKAEGLTEADFDPHQVLMSETRKAARRRLGRKHSSLHAMSVERGRAKKGKAAALAKIAHINEETQR